jgi:hypothetical protein
MSNPTRYKSTVVGILLAGVVLYAGQRELTTPPLHTVHAGILAGLLLLALALILGDDGFFATLKRFADLAVPFLPWKRGAP